MKQKLKKINSINNPSVIKNENNKVMVTISPSPHSEYLIKYTEKISSGLKNNWLVLYVEKSEKLSEKEERNLTKNLKLARELGGEVIITAAENIVNGIIRIAEKNNVSKIIIGKPLHRSIKDIILGRNFIDKLLKYSKEINITIVSPPKVKTKKRGVILPKFNLKKNFKEYLTSISTIFIITILNLLLLRIIDYWSVAMIYLATVSILGIFLSRWPIVLAALLSALIWDFIFIPPIFTFYIGKTKDSFMLIMYFFVAIITGNLTSKLHLKEISLRKREKRITELYEISNIISNSTDIDEVIEKSIKLIEKTFNSKVNIILTNGKDTLDNISHRLSSFKLNNKSFYTALWSFNNEKNAGRFTNILDKSDIMFIPLIASNNVVGVLSVKFTENYSLDIEQEDLLQNFSKQIAMAIESDLLKELNKKAMIQAESEKLYKIILNSISHELKTPLTSISNAANGLKDKKMFTKSDIRNILLDDIIESSDRMNRIVGNLLDMIRLESGKLKLNMEWNDVNDIISTVLKKMNNDLKNYKFKKEIDKKLPLLYADFVLIEQVLTNIILNAIQHNKEGIQIILKIFKKGNYIYFVVRDNGIGIPKTEQEKVFDKFYRISRSKTGGTGLGLSICRSIIELHNGKIYAENNKYDGVSFIFYLPVNEMKIKEII